MDSFFFYFGMLSRNIGVESKLIIYIHILCIILVNKNFKAKNVYKVCVCVLEKESKLNILFNNSNLHTHKKVFILKEKDRGRFFVCVICGRRTYLYISGN